jgi:hypothetical protein
MYEKAVKSSQEETTEASFLKSSAVVLKLTKSEYFIHPIVLYHSTLGVKEITPPQMKKPKIRNTREKHVLIEFFSQNIHKVLAF